MVVAKRIKTLKKKLQLRHIISFDDRSCEKLEVTVKHSFRSLFEVLLKLTFLKLVDPSVSIDTPTNQSFAMHF